MKARFQPIQDNRLRGYEALSRDGRLRVEVVAQYLEYNEWAVFCHIDNRPCRPLSAHADQNIPLKRAKALALKILKNWDSRDNDHYMPMLVEGS
jgi:hypothetical protein